MPQINQRSYVHGDRVVMLGKTVMGDEVRALHEVGNKYLTAASLMAQPLTLVDGVAREVYKGRNGDSDVLVVRYHPLDNQPEDLAGQRDSEFILSDRFLAQRIGIFRNILAAVPMERPKIDFLKQFLLPVVVSSAGYQTLLRDFAAIVAPDREVDGGGDISAIKAQAEAFGIPFRKYLSSSKRIELRQVTEATERAYEMLGAPVPVQQALNPPADLRVALMDIEAQPPLWFAEPQLAEAPPDEEYDGDDDDRDEDDDN